MVKNFGYSNLYHCNAVYEFVSVKDKDKNIADVKCDNLQAFVGPCTRCKADETSLELFKGKKLNKKYIFIGDNSLEEIK